MPDNTLRQQVERLERELAEALSVHRWSVDDAGNGTLYICREDHGKGEKCEWEAFVPAERAGEKIARLENELVQTRDTWSEWLAQANGKLRAAEAELARIRTVDDAMVERAATVLLGRVNAPEQEIYAAARDAITAALEGKA